MNKRSAFAQTSAEHFNQEETSMKRAYKKPVLRRLGLLRQVTRFSF